MMLINYANLSLRVIARCVRVLQEISGYRVDINNIYCDYGSNVAASFIYSTRNTATVCVEMSALGT